MSGMDEHEVFKQPVQRVAAFGLRLTEARKRAGYGSQVALANRMRLHRLTVHRHESQGMLPHRRVLEEYAFVLGVTPQWLLYGSDDPLLDLPVAVRDYLVRERGSMRPETFDRLARVPWLVIGDEEVDELDVGHVRLLIDRNLDKRDRRGQSIAPYRDASRAPSEQLPLRSLDVGPGSPQRSRRTLSRAPQAAVP